MSTALGLIETVGLAAAIEALDVALKTADVTAREIENSRGEGRQTVKIVGSVSAVQAAVQAGAAAAERVSSVYAVKVIARPSDELERFMAAPSVNAQTAKEPKEAELPAAEEKPAKTKEAPRRKSGKK